MQSLGTICQVTTLPCFLALFQVVFSSLDLVLHTEALLSIMSFLTFGVSSSAPSSTEKASDHKPQIEEQEKGSALRPGNVIIKSMLLLHGSIQPLFSKDTISSDSTAACSVKRQAQLHVERKRSYLKKPKTLLCIMLVFGEAR